MLKHKINSLYIISTLNVIYITIMFSFYVLNKSEVCLEIICILLLLKYIL